MYRSQRAGSTRLQDTPLTARPGLSRRRQPALTTSRRASQRAVPANIAVAKARCQTDCCNCLIGCGLTSHSCPLSIPFQYTQGSTFDFKIHDTRSALVPLMNQFGKLDRDRKSVGEG